MSSPEALAEEAQPVQQDPRLDADDAEGSGSSDIDSALNVGSSNASSTETMNSSVFDFTYENGRRYHSFHAGSYPLPNDEQEQDRLDLYHHIWSMLTKGELYTAPMANPPQRVLDVGTGTGVWAIDMADAYPFAEVVGNDLSPVQPTWIPPNCRFEVDDAESPWAFSAPFDLVHLRNMSGCFQKWESVLEQCYKFTSPGGYTEIHEFDYLLQSASSNPSDKSLGFPQWWDIVVSCAEKAGRPFVPGPELKAMMEDVGFVNVEIKSDYWPFSSWPKDKKLKEVGMYAKAGVIEGLIPYSMALLTRVLGWSMEDVDKLCKSAREDLSGKGKRYYCKACFVVGQRPEKKKEPEV